MWSKWPSKLIIECDFLKNSSFLQRESRFIFTCSYDYLDEIPTYGTHYFKTEKQLRF